MAYNPVEALRAAGFINATVAADIEEFYASLTQEETEVLISVTERLKSVLPDVVPHSQGWATPAATQEGLDAAMLCACGAWSGAGKALD